MTINITAIDARLRELKTQSEEIQREMQELGTLLMLAKKYTVGQSKSPLEPVVGNALKAMDAAILGNAKTKRACIIDTTTEILNDGVRRSSRFLVRELRARGIEIGNSGDESKEAAALAAYLSKEEGVFDSNLKLGGWTLSSLLQTARPDNVATLSGLFINGSQATSPRGSVVVGGTELA